MMRGSVRGSAGSLSTARRPSRRSSIEWPQCAKMAMEELVLLAVVVAHQRQRHAGFLGDLADRHHVVAVAREQLLGRQQDRLLAVGPRRLGGGRSALDRQGAGVHGPY
jgi:hypothetical protein